MIVIRNYGFPILPQATALWQAKNYDGGHKWLDEIGSANFQFGSATASAYIGRESYGDEVGLVLPGTSGNYASTPDTAALDITGDITCVGYGSAQDWTRTTPYNSILGKWTTTGNQRAYALQISPTGTVDFYWSTTGANTVGAPSTASVPFTDGQAGWFAATLDVDNGVGGYDLKFWISSDGDTWTQLGATVTGGAPTSIYSSTGVLEVGSIIVGTNGYWGGTITRTQVWSGVRDLNAASGGTLVFDADFSTQTPGATSFTEGTGKVVTVNRSTTGVDTNDPQWLPHSTSQNPFGAGVDYVYLPGASGNYISTPDTAALDITGDIELIARISVVQWVSGGDRAIISKHGSASGDYGPYAWRVSNNGTMLLGLASNSTTFASAASTVALSGALAKWVRVTADISGCTTRFYYSNETTADPTAVTWTQLGSDVSGTTIASLNSSNNPVCVGTWNENGTSDIFNGSVSRALVYNGIGGTLAADFNPDGGTLNSAQTTLTGTGDGLTWTFNRAATGRKLAVVDEDKFLLGTDDYFTTPSFSGANFTGDFTIVTKTRVNQVAGAVYPALLQKSHDGVTLPDDGWHLGAGGSGTVEDFRSTTRSAGVWQAVVTGTDPMPAYPLVVTATRSGTSLTLYEDAVQKDTDTVSAADLTNTNSVFIGFQNIYYLDGEIIAAAIFKGKALSAAEVAQVVSELGS